MGLIKSHEGGGKTFDEIVRRRHVFTLVVARKLSVIRVSASCNNLLTGSTATKPVKEESLSG